MRRKTDSEMRGVSSKGEPRNPKEKPKTDYRSNLVNLEKAVRNLMRDGGDTGYEDLLETKLLKRLLGEDLGVLGGAYALAHKSRNELVLLHNSEYPPQVTGVPSIDIPYYPKYMNGKVGDLIDLLFIGSRKMQPLTGANPPEVYRNIPPHEDADHLPYLPFEEELRKEPSTRFSFLYCTVGEVAFFTYAWRWLVRYCQQYGIIEEVVPDRAIRYRDIDPDRRDFWTQRFWREIGFCQEVNWLTALREFEDEWDRLKKSKASADVKRAKFLSRALRRWKNAKKEFDVIKPTIENSDAPSDDLLSEWHALGLLDRGQKATRTLLALVRYVYHLCKPRDRREGSCVPEGNAGLRLQETLQSILIDLEGSFRSGIPVTVKNLDIPELDRTIRCVALAILSRKEGKLTVVNALRRLHDTVRFPIIPMFYWTALDEEKRPREHLVMATGMSYSTPVTVRIHSKDQFSPNVELVLLAISPPWDLKKPVSLTEDDIPEHRDEAEISEESLSRIERIYELFRAAGRPILEIGFYGILAKPGWEATGARNRSIVSGHEAGAQVAALSRLFPYCSDPQVADIARGSSTYARLFLSETISDLRNEKPLRSNCRSAREWLQACVELAWLVTLAREGRSLYTREEIIGKEGIVTLVSRRPDVKLILKPSNQVPVDGQLKHDFPFLDWDLTRWMISAFSNAMKWAGPGADRSSGKELLQRWVRDSRFRRIVVFLGSRANRTEISIYNGFHSRARHVPNQNVPSGIGSGTGSVLTSIASSLPRMDRVRFEETADEESQTFLPGEKHGWVSSVSLNLGLFTEGTGQTGRKV